MATITTSHSSHSAQSAHSHSALKLQCCGTFKPVRLRYRGRISEREYDYARSCAVEPRWEIDGRFYCFRHFELYWEKGNYVDEHQVRRLFDEDIQEAFAEMAARRK